MRLERFVADVRMIAATTEVLRWMTRSTEEAAEEARTAFVRACMSR
jgi:hypothetical protein